MRFKAFVLGLATLLLWGLPAFSQGNPTGKLSGRVTSGNEPLPGVKVTASSPNLQGTKSTATSTNGDYLFPSLPPGEYSVVFESPGLVTVTQELRVAAAQASTLDAEMAAEAITEEISVTGNLETISQGVQTATTYTKRLVDELPAGRTISQIVALSPGVQPNGPSKDATTGLGNITISGAPTYENLFLLNGVVLNENLRGQAFDLYIEEAVQEITTASAGISAEYGRFSGGVVNIITKSGGNAFSGSLRTTFNNQTWEEKRPDPVRGGFAPQTDKTIPTYEATLGGPVLRDRLWFFAAGRSVDRSTTQLTTLTSIPYANERDQQRYEGKLTATITPQHTLLGSYLKINDKENGNIFPPVLDLDSLVNRETPQKAWSINYTGTYSDNLLLTAQYSKRQFTFVGSGADSTDLIDGTLILAAALGNGRYHSATFCGVCEPEHRDNKNALLKASYFLSTPSLGSHDLVAGYDTYDDIRNANNHQSGSDYRIIGTSAIIRGTDIFPVFNNDGSTTIQFNPIPNLSRGTSFKTNSLYANDTWRASDRLTLNLGLRYDKNDGKDAEGKKVAKDSNLSPRLGATYDPWRNGRWIFHGSYAKYVAAIANSIGDSTSSAGAPQTFQWAYAGPAINTVAGAPLLTQDQALRVLFDWFNANGGPTGSLPLVGINIPGGNTKIQGSLDSPNVVEYSVGVEARLGGRGVVRADLIHRDWADFYSSRLDLSTGRVVAGNGPADLGLIGNNDSLYERKYDGLHTQFRFRASDRIDLGGNWTLSHTQGNFDGENQGSGPLIGGLGRYPEYRDLRWAAPKGDLLVDQRHRVSLYGLFKLFSGKSQELTFNVLQSYATGHPYGAAGTITLLARPNDVSSNYVTNPGYLTPPTTASYFFTDRDAFRTPDIYRTDIAFNYTFRLGRINLFVHPEMINVFNQQRIDTTAADLFNTTVLTANNNSSLARFNPFTTTPVRGVNWQTGPSFGKAVNPLAFQQPRTYRFLVGIRF